jgi:hypothetical protein
MMPIVLIRAPDRRPLHGNDNLPDVITPSLFGHQTIPLMSFLWPSRPSTITLLTDHVC